MPDAFDLFADKVIPAMRQMAHAALASDFTQCLQLRLRVVLEDGTGQRKVVTLFCRAERPTPSDLTDPAFLET